MPTDRQADESTTGAGEQTALSMQLKTSIAGALLPPPPRPALVPAVEGYADLQLLGQGGMGVVYRARHVRLNRIVALKTIALRLDLLGERRQAVLERFQREAEAVARLQHPGIVGVFEVGEWGGLPFLVLEFVAGGSLARQLAGQPRPPEEAARLVAQLARAVQAAHDRGVVHRDLKPENVLLAEDGTPKITDFGLARLVGAGDEESRGLTQTGAILGTPSYMAPEQARPGQVPVGPPADVYALGAILYASLTGRPPFLAATPLDTAVQVAMDEPVPPRLLNPKVPRDLDTVCLKCLSKSPVQRYGSATALAEDLDRFLEGKPVLARPVGLAARAWRWARRKPVLSAALLALALSLLGGLTTTTVLWKAEVQQRRRVEVREELLDQVVGSVLDDARRALTADMVAFAREYLNPLEQKEEAKAGHAGTSLTEPERRLLPGPGERIGSPLALVARLKRLEGLLERERGDSNGSGQVLPLAEQVGRTWFLLGAAEFRRGRHAEASRCFERCRTLLDECVRGGATADAQDLLARALVMLGQECSRQRDLQGAEDGFARAQALWRGLLAAEGPAPAWRDGLTAVDLNRAILKMQAGDEAGARSLLEEADRRQEELVKEVPADLVVAGRQPLLYRFLALLHRRAGRTQEAVHQLEKARRTQAELGRRSPEVRAWRSGQAGQALAEGREQLRASRRREALESFSRACRLLDELAGSQPDSALSAARLSAHTYRGVVLQAQRQKQQAAAAYAEALACLKEAARADPGMKADELGETAFVLGAALMNLDDQARSLVALNQAAAWQEQALRFDPAGSQTRQALSRTLFHIGHAQRQFGRVADAAATCRRRLKLWPRNPDESYDGACELLRCAAAATGEKEREAYLDEALRVLRQAVQGGLKGAAQVRRDPDMKPLLGRSEFKQLLAEMENRQKR